MGPSIILAKKIGKKLGKQVKILPAKPWLRVKKMLRNAQVDMVVGLKRTSDRERYIYFANTPVAPNPMSIFVRKGEKKTKDIAGWMDLMSLTGVMSLGDNYGAEFDIFLNKNLDMIQAKDPKSALRLLKESRGEFAILGAATGNYFLQQEGWATEMHEKFQINNGLIYLGVAKKSKCAAIVKDIDLILKSMNQTKELQKIYQFKN